MNTTLQSEHLACVDDIILASNIDKGTHKAEGREAKIRKSWISSEPKNRGKNRSKIDWALKQKRKINNYCKKDSMR